MTCQTVEHSTRSASYTGSMWQSSDMVVTLDCHKSSTECDSHMPVGFRHGAVCAAPPGRHASCMPSIEMVAMTARPCQWCESLVVQHSCCSFSSTAPLVPHNCTDGHLAAHADARATYVLAWNHFSQQSPESGGCPMVAAMPQKFASHQP